MKQFLKFTLASIVGILIAGLLLLFITIGVITAMVSSSDQPAQIQANTMLLLKFDYNIVDRAQKNPFEWVQHAHKLYVTARVLYGKRFPHEFALIGAHALEIYFKAFIIYKTGKYKPGHDLSSLYKNCMKLDPFFKDELLSKYFLPEKAPKSLTPALWDRYTPFLRYPESLKAGKILGGFAITSDALKSLDCIAHFMYKTIPTDGERLKIWKSSTGKTEEVVGVVEDLLDGKGDYHSLGNEEDSSEIKELFLRDNSYFTSQHK